MKRLYFTRLRLQVASHNAAQTREEAPPSSNRNSKTGEKKSETAPSTAQASLADELSATHIDTPHDGYESSTHTDNDDFEDAADGSPADGITPSSSAAMLEQATVEQASDAKTDDAAAEGASNEDTADEKLARRSSLAAHATEAQAHTPRPSDGAFPSVSEETTTSAATETADESIVASSSTATFTASSSSNDNSQSVNTDIPLSSAEIRDSQSASEWLILDEEKVKATLPEHVDKVPPSVGATSLLEPDETISNPFATDDSSQPRRYSQPDTTEAPHQPPDTPG